MSDQSDKKPNGHDHGQWDNVSKFPESVKERRELKEKLESARQPPPAPSEPAFNLPPMVKALSLILVAFHLGMLILPDEKAFTLTYRLAFVPGRYAGMGLNLFDPEVLTIFTHILVHGGWLHLLTNVGMLMAFGAAVEKSVGPSRFFIFFIVCGILGAVAHFLFYMNSLDPMIGASGAISGLFGAVLRLMPGGQSWRRIAPFIALWIGVSVLFGFIGMPGAGGSTAIAWAVHIGGFAAGLLLFRPLCQYNSLRR